LHASGYDRWVAIEMREQAEDPLRAIAAAVRVVQALYGFRL
jgi:hypothetical protein